MRKGSMGGPRIEPRGSRDRLVLIKQVGEYVLAEWYANSDICAGI